MKKKNSMRSGEFLLSYNAKNRTLSEDRLSDIFAEVGQRYGYDDVKAEYAPLTDFKVRWNRSYRWIRFQVSDYIDRAPEDAVRNVAEVIFSKISGDDRGYGDVFIQYVNDPKIVKQNQKDFIKRSRNLNNTSIGDYHDLNDCVNRLRQQGLLPDDIECTLRWDNSTSSKVSGCSVLQRVVWVNKILDQKGVPEYVLDFSVYAMMCHLIQGFNNNDEIAYDRMTNKYPMVDDAYLWINQHGLYL